MSSRKEEKEKRHLHGYLMHLFTRFAAQVTGIIKIPRNQVDFIVFAL